MPLCTPDWRHGTRQASALITFTAATTPAIVWTLSGAGITPTAQRTAVIRKIDCQNSGGTSTFLSFGTGTALFVAAMPGKQILNGSDAQWPEDLIAAVEFFANITAQMSAATTSLLVQIEVVEYEGGQAHG